MNCCVTDLRNKEVINTKNGHRLGCVSDVEICCENGQLCAIIIWGKGKVFDLVGKCDDIRIPWKDIQVIGEETVLVCVDECDCCCAREKDKRRLFENLFG